jgi:hypothetical protein
MSQGDRPLPGGGAWRGTRRASYSPTTSIGSGSMLTHREGSGVSEPHYRGTLET